MDRITLTAPDISCEHCKNAIEREVGSLPGVQAVSVDVPATRIDVTFDPAATSRQAIESLLDEEGYPVAG